MGSWAMGSVGAVLEDCTRVDRAGGAPSGLADRQKLCGGLL